VIPSIPDFKNLPLRNEGISQAPYAFRMLSSRVRSAETSLAGAPNQGPQSKAQ
jgi:hypothetical protein